MPLGTSVLLAPTGRELVDLCVLFDVQLLQQSGSGPNSGALSNLSNLGLGESVVTLILVRPPLLSLTVTPISECCYGSRIYIVGHFHQVFEEKCGNGFCLSMFLF